MLEMCQFIKHLTSTYYSQVTRVRFLKIKSSKILYGHAIYHSIRQSMYMYSQNMDVVITDKVDNIIQKQKNVLTFPAAFLASYYVKISRRPVNRF
jgi:hypothetical protein